MAARGRTPGGRTRTEEDLLDTEGGLPEKDDETDTSFTSLEQHLFGSRHFDHQGEMYEGEQTTMLQPPGEQETVMQHDMNAPPPVQIVVELPPGSRPSLDAIGRAATPSGTARTSIPPQQGKIIAASGVFAGMSFVMAGALVSLGIAAAALILLVVYPPRSWAPGTIAVPVTQVVEVDGEQAPPSSLPSDLAEGVRFPAMFGFNDWRAQELDQGALEMLVGRLSGCNVIQLTGHTDPKGDDLTNDRVAIARAGEVRKILIAMGLERERIEVSSAGSAVPEIEDASPEARALNRRVTVRCR